MMQSVRRAAAVHSATWSMDASPRRFERYVCSLAHFIQDMKLDVKNFNYAERYINPFTLTALAPYTIATRELHTQ